jgi:hypothetical protein
VLIHSMCLLLYSYSVVFALCHLCQQAEARVNLANLKELRQGLGL